MLIKLTKVGGMNVFVNPFAANYINTDGNASFLHFGPNEVLAVQESPERIIELATTPAHMLDVPAGEREEPGASLRERLAEEEQSAQGEAPNPLKLAQADANSANTAAAPKSAAASSNANKPKRGTRVDPGWKAIAADIKAKQAADEEKTRLEVERVEREHAAAQAQANADASKPADAPQG